MWSCFSAEENLIHPHHIFHIIPHYQKEFCLYSKLHCKIQKMLLNCQKFFCLQQTKRIYYVSEFQMIIQMLSDMLFPKCLDLKLFLSVLNIPIALFNFIWTWGNCSFQCKCSSRSTPRYLTFIWLHSTFIVCKMLCFWKLYTSV